MNKLLRAAWPAIAVFIAHGLAARAWGHEPSVDPVMHFMGGLAIAYLFLVSFSDPPAWLGTPSPLGVALLALGLTSCVSLAWECGEMLSDIFLGTRVQFSAANTLRDLALDLAGAIALLALSAALRRSRPIATAGAK